MPLPPIRLSALADRTPELRAGWGPKRYSHGVPTPRGHVAVYESEDEYLDRLNLWLPGERDLFDRLYPEEPDAREDHRDKTLFEGRVFWVVGDHETGIAVGLRYASGLVKSL